MRHDISSPTEFFIESMDKLDDVVMVTIIRRHKDGGISFDTNTHSRFDSYAMTSMAAAFAQADIISGTLRDY